MFYLPIRFSVVTYFTVRGLSIQLKKSKYNILLKTSWLKYHSSMSELPLGFVAIVIYYVCGVLKKTYSGNSRPLKFITLLPTTTAD